jgi:predicted GNAT superfamily acetyltransferase
MVPLLNARFPVTGLAMSVTYCSNYYSLFPDDVSNEVRENRAVYSTVPALSFSP